MNLRPPIADELFADRDAFRNAMQLFPRCLEIIPYLQQRQSDKTVEKVLEELQAEGTDRRKRQLAAIRWYLQLMLSQCEHNWFQEVAKGTSNYLTLLDQIEIHRREEPVSIVTFNYDTLLERALPSVGVNLDQIGQFIGYGSYKVFKVHGSINWAREIESPRLVMSFSDQYGAVNEIIERSPAITFGQRFIKTNQVPICNNGETPLFPAIAIPVETKTHNSFECPADHIEHLRVLLPDTRKILIVGWRGMEAHFVKLLRERLKQDASIPTMIVSSNGESAASIGNRLKAQIPIDFVAAHVEGFTGFVTNRTVESFLKG
jgi:hypothetical protein